MEAKFKVPKLCDKKHIFRYAFPAQAKCVIQFILPNYLLNGL